MRKLAVDMNIKTHPDRLNERKDLNGQKGVGLFLEAWIWPFTRPELNLLDYAVWGTLEQCTTRTSRPSADHRKQVLMVAMFNLSINLDYRKLLRFRRRV